MKLLGGRHVASNPAGLANSKLVLPHGLRGHASVAPLRLPRHRLPGVVARCQLQNAQLQNAVGHSSSAAVASGLVYVQAGAGAAGLEAFRNDCVLKSKWLELSDRECATAAAAAAPSVLVTDHDHAQSHLALENFMVGNFVLNPLQLQSLEKTLSADCYTRGQGPMQLASFEVQTVPLDVDCHSASEEVSDPNCGEAAIGRVAPLDSGNIAYKSEAPVESTEWMPEQVGCFIGNLQPAPMDFRVFPLESLWSIVGSLATAEQAEVILDLLETRWTDFVGNMPLKTCFLALEGEEWRIITNINPETTLWSHHNDGPRPTLLWQMLHGALVLQQFTVACIKMKGPRLAQRAVEVTGKRISKDRWPEHYDTRTAWLNIENESWLYQIGSVARVVLANPHAADMLTCEAVTVQAKTCLLEEAKTNEQGHVNGARDRV